MSSASTFIFISFVAFFAYKLIFQRKKQEKKERKEKEEDERKEKEREGKKNNFTLAHVFIYREKRVHGVATNNYS